MKMIPGKALIFFVAAGVWPLRAAPVEPTAPVPPTLSPTAPAGPDVTRGQSILLVALAEGFRLSAPGRALKDGNAGDTIPILNTATRKTLKGVVRDGWIEIQSFEGQTP
jgi:hypothetical protein